MVQVVRVVDDLDESDAAETVQFGLGGRWYDIDLNADHAEELKAEIGWWVQHARKHGSTPKAVPKRTQRPADQVETMPTHEWWRTPEDASDAEQQRYHEMRQEIREWGLRNGWPSLGDRGRLPRALYAKWWERTHTKHRKPDRDDEPDIEQETAADEAEGDTQGALGMATPPFSDHTKRRAGRRTAPGRKPTRSKTVAGVA
ncbi:MAG TPA: histone-like nucleoid-structuring protein Lsr2 [Pseudonocardiaceae bacterium]|nr:histone-like nucleoid-structuring protein Lsr2 [Pseudonocardiaceae bacterium]